MLNTPVKAVIPSLNNSNLQLHLVNGSHIDYDHVISTMPITLLVQQMNAPTKVKDHVKSLKFRNTILVYLLVEGKSPFPDQWIYVNSTNLKTGRITNFRNWVPSTINRKSDTILCLEYWCNNHDELWKMTEEELVKLATKEIYETNLIVRDTVKDGSIVRIPKCYPVYKSGYKEHLKPVEEFLSQQRNISVIGRYGAFKYNNQDHSILMGILAAENILEGANHNLWDLNTDYEYQESSKITATGLASNK